LTGLAAVALGGVLVAAARLNVTTPGASLTALDSAGVIRQRTTRDCGVAAVAMLIRERVGDVDLEELWRSVHVPRGGLSLPEMVSLAGRYGVPAAPLALATRHAGILPTPWIAHLSWNHYVVVESTADGKLVIADPRGFRYALSEDAFTRVWSGYGLRLVDDSH
jgi:ATP-binding cassette subfamily B protein